MLRCPLLSIWLLGALMFCLPLSAGAQQLGFAQSSILTIESDRLFSQSSFGQRIEDEIEAEGRVLASEIRWIAADLSAEEEALTKRRAELSPQEFRVLADTFDKKVSEIRIAQDTKARSLNTLRDEARARFFDAARPVLASLLRERGAVVILERSSVFVSANAIDITEQAIARMNVVIGDGSDL